MKSPDDSLSFYYTQPDQGPAATAKVLRINQRWIVHGHLREDTAGYLTHLAQQDPARLQSACELVLRLVRRRLPPRDPKPLFYGALFALATPEEIERFLPEHPLTRTICLLLHGDPSGLDALQPPVRQLAGEVAAEVGEVLAPV